MRSDEPKKRWRVIQYLGGYSGAAAEAWQETQNVSGSPENCSDEILIRRAGLRGVAVPVVVVRQ